VSQTQDLKSQVSTLVDAVKALAVGWKDKAIAQAKPKAKSAGILGGAFGGAAYLAVKAFWLLLLAGSAGFGALYSRFMGPWAATALDSNEHPPRAGLGWHDTAVRLEGPAVADVAGHFRMRWRAVADWPREPSEPRGHDEVGEIARAGLRYLPLPVSHESLGDRQFDVLRDFLREPGNRPKRPPRRHIKPTCKR